MNAATLFTAQQQAHIREVLNTHMDNPGTTHILLAHVELEHCDTVKKVTWYTVSACVPYTDKIFKISVGRFSDRRRQVLTKYDVHQFELQEEA